MNKKRVISEYLVQSMKGERWLLKDAAIAMAEEGRLHAIVVHAKNGNYYYKLLDLHINEI